MAYLNNISSPEDVKKLSIAELNELSDEIRAFLIDSVSKTGGHLSSNLGTIELTLALHKVFTTPNDKIVWDVGHQCYTHKIVTGRKDEFDGLRKLNGISGFPAPKESEHDVFISGHGNTAIAVAIGLANAKKLRGEPGKVIAIVGDGAFTGGMVYEGMNNVRTLNNLIVVLNDNTMSISKNVGAVAQYLTKLRTNPSYFDVKRHVESFLDKIPGVGKGIKISLQTVKAGLRRVMYHSTMFEEMGFQYVGTINGHSISELCALFSAYKNDQAAPLFIHIATVKGKGFTPAEENPGEFHGVSAFDVNHLTDPDVSPDSSFSTVFGRQLALLADDNARLCAITAAMKYGTGLQYFYKQHKSRFYDVGMAEQYAVTFAAGLAAGGMLPVVAVYSTFLQRSYDQLIHDISLMQLPVLFAVDRAGLVPGDGETHQGIYDAAYLSQVTGMRIVSPCNYAELEYWLKNFLAHLSGPCALRYARGAEPEALSALPCTGAEYDVFPAQGRAKTALVTYGVEAQEALCAQQMTAGTPAQADVYKLCVIHPLPEGLMEALLHYDAVVFAEEGIGTGGIGEHLAVALQRQGYRGVYRHIAVDPKCITHATTAQLIALCKLDAESLKKQLKEVCSEDPT